MGPKKEIQSGIRSRAMLHEAVPAAEHAVITDGFAGLSAEVAGRGLQWKQLRGTTI
jgi:hypothetical protein